MSGDTSSRESRLQTTDLANRPDPIPASGLQGFAPPSDAYDPEYWEALINEDTAARFLGFSVRALQGWRYRGGGPRYVRVSARGIRYRRKDCRTWSEARLRTSTSDPGDQAAKTAPRGA